MPAPSARSRRRGWRRSSHGRPRRRARPSSTAPREWQLEPAGLTAADGRVTAADGRSLTYGELAADTSPGGPVRADLPLSDPAEWRVRGRTVAKVNGRGFVTGGHVFVSDMLRPGLLHGRVLRPPSVGASLLSADLSGASAMPGVSAVRDGEFVGVAAPDPRAADRALRAIRTEWRPLPHQPSSATVYEHLKKTGQSGGGRGSGPYSSGDVVRARASAAHTFDASYRIPYIAHVPLEPRAAVAEWTDGALTVWTGTQRPFGVRTELARAFHLPDERVRVIVPDMGSGYGGKHTGEVAVEAARLARAAGGPVKLVWTRSGEFTWAYFRPAGVIDIAAAVDARGHLVAWEFDSWNSGGSGIRSPYEVPNQRIAFHASDSPLRQGSYRGLAATANHYAREMHMDEIARGLGVDAVEFRVRHLRNDRLRAVLTAAAEKVGWPGPAAASGGSSRASTPRALGIACGTEKGSYVATAAELVRTDEGFRVERLTVAFECAARSSIRTACTTRWRERSCRGWEVRSSRRSTSGTG